MFFFSNNYDTEFKPKSLEHAYLAIVNNDLATARVVFEGLDSPRAKWGKALVDILIGYIEKYPTYFEIRNFLEIDLDFLIKNKKWLSHLRQPLRFYTFFFISTADMMQAAARQPEITRTKIFPVAAKVEIVSTAA